jgi:uncharacterized membrane protein (DUF2068 family)
MNSRGHSDRVVLLIGVLKLVKASLLIVVAVGALRLMHQDAAAVLAEWIGALRVDPQGTFVKFVLEHLGVVDDRLLTAISAASLFYAALLATEGVGLCLCLRWAEYMTVIITSSYLPWEIYLLSRRFSLLKTAVILLNVLIVWYLIHALRRDARQATRDENADEA